MATTFPIVGVGASAGGLEAFGQIISQLPRDCGIALVVIQHLDPNRDSQLSEILSKHSEMPVEEIRDGQKIAPNHVYIAPSNHKISLQKGVLRLRPPHRKTADQNSVDFFFSSLAKDRKGGAVGVILSGTGADGTNGLKAIKEAGGVTIAQKPSSAKFGAMPQNAITQGAVDLILTPGRIAKELAALGGKSRGPSRAGSSVSQVHGLLRAKFHVDFSNYKQTTINRRIERRMTLTRKTRIEDYLKFLKSNSQELRLLFTDLLIHVTSFFRDPEVFAELRKHVFPRIVKTRKLAAPIRIWVVGCSTGEEAYSVAIALLEYLGEHSHKTPIQIFATDLSESAIQRARAGAFPESIREQVSEKRLKRFFVKTEGGYRISKFVRDLCLFSRHDLTCDPPFARLDLICCRNVLIYFDSQLQKRVLPALQYSLNPGGVLWLGRSESVSNHPTGFKVIDKAGKFYVRSETAALPRLPLAGGHFGGERPIPLVTSPVLPSQSASEGSREIEQLLSAEYAPPAVVINSNSEIVLSKGNTAPFLQLPPGQSSLNLFKMARPELAHDLRIAVQSFRKRGLAVRREGLTLRDGDAHRALSIRVLPLKAMSSKDDQRALVVFEPAPAAVDVALPTSKHKAGERKLAELERQLAEARKYQQSLIDDHEAGQQEITSANEELQSTNEELQSTNEELETAKEELESTNEELTTVNDELQNRNNDLSLVNSDLVNVLGTVDFPIILVDPHGRIRRFTGAAGKMLNLLAGDVGRPIGDIRPSFEGPELQKLVSEVMESISAQEHEVRGRDGRWYRLQARPYKTIDNRIAGAVISLVDITLLKRLVLESQGKPKKRGR